MLRIFYGPDRLGAEKAIKQALGEAHEVFEGQNLILTDLPSIFLGTSLFGDERRRILLKDVSENTSVWEKLADYVKTEFDVIDWEMKLDKRSSGYKRLKDTRVEIVEFAEPRRPEMNLVFNIFDTALEGEGRKAIKMIQQIEQEQDPYMFFGLMVTQALKKFETAKCPKREAGILKELAKLDLQMKSAAIEPWMLVKSFLLEIGGQQDA